MNKDYIDFNQCTNYVIQWLEESKNARWEYQRQMYRVDKALYGKPWKNLYQEELDSNLKKAKENCTDKSKQELCLKVPEGQSFVLSKAVNTRANQVSGGVDTYEYSINDPYMLVDDDTEDLLAAQCEQDYIQNRLELMSPVFSKDLSNYGIAAVYVSYDQERERNVVERVNPKNLWWDTMYSATGNERFRGFSRMISWDSLKKLIEECGDEINVGLEVPNKSMFNKNGDIDKHIKIGKKKIKTLNDIDIYIEDMNKLATSPSLQAPQNEHWEYDHDLRNCYNLNWYHSFSTDGEAKTKSGYNGQDVELTIIYDLARKIEFKIINRRFIISANKNAFKRSIAFPIYNPEKDETNVKIADFHLDCPLKFQFEEWDARDKYHYPTSPVMKYLDIHDQLCAWRAKRDHVTKILSILRIASNGADADSLRNILNIMGVVIDDMQSDIATINFEYNYEPIDSQIAYLENTIIEGLNAYNQFDALQTMGDRASAAESGMAVGAIAQGLATHQNTIMALYADIARQCIANRVAYSVQQEFPINNMGDYSSITIQQMALDAIVNVKPKLTKKVQEKQLATNALTLLGTLRDVLTPDGIAYFSEQALFGNVPRKLASTFVQQPGASQDEIAAAQQQAQNQANMLQQNQQMYEQNPIPYEVQNAQQQLSPDEMDQLITGLQASDGGASSQDAMAAAAEQGQPAPEEEGAGFPPGLSQMMGGQGEVSPETVDMPEQEGAMTANLEGMTPELGSQLANPSGDML